MTARSDGSTSERSWQQAAAGLLWPLAGMALLLALWWAVLAFAVSDTSMLQRFAPGGTFRALVDLLRSGELWPHLLISLRRVLLGLAISAGIGLPLGLLVGSSRLAMRASSGAFQFLRMISPLSWTPLAIIVFGVGDVPVLFLIVIAAVWPVVLNTAAGVSALDPRWLAVGRSMGATRWELLRSIVWPGIRPHVLTGLRLSVGLAWIILVPAEMLGVDSGLGYYILDSRDRLAYEQVMAVILTIGVCGFVLDLAARWLFRERRHGRPRRSARRSVAPALQPGGAGVETAG
jgi:NitT/TauT family transport system permease protein